MIELDMSPEQAILRQTVIRFLREKYDFSKRQKIIKSHNGCDETIWASFAEMGWLGIPFDEEWGGASGSRYDLVLLAESFGRALVVEPYLSTVVLGGLTIQQHGSDAQRRKVLPDLVAGRTQVAAACYEPKSSYDPFDVVTQVRQSGGRWIIDGQKAVVLGAPSADYFVVSARISGGRSDHEGLALFLLEKDRPGISLRGYRTIDGRGAAELTLTNVEATKDDLLGDEGSSGKAIAEAVEAGALFLASEAAGAMAAALEMTADYLNQREQYGHKLASYQALRHRVADMYVRKQEASALVIAAVRAADSGATEKGALVSAAKAYIGQEGRKLAEDAVQLHGAIAITDEYIVGHYLKKMIATDRMFGDVSHHLSMYYVQASQA